MREKIILLASIIIFTTSGIIFGQVTTDDAWINEFHYDNDGADVNEFVEVVIKNVGSYNLNDFTLTLYNGSNGNPYGTPITLDAFTSSQVIGEYTFHYYVLPINGLQNGDPDGLSIDHQGSSIQFLSYEGEFTGVGGPADGILSEDVGVSESGGATAPEAYSLQITGSGYGYDDFIWNGPDEDSPGALNAGQYLFPILEFNAKNVMVNESDGAVNIPIKIINPDGNPIDVDVVFQQNPSSAEATDFSSYITQTVSFGAGATDGEIQNASFTLNNDADFEGLEKAEFILTNVVSSGLAEIVGQSDFTLTVGDDETPNVVINEIHADPDATNGDADGNGNVAADDDEFVEIVNGESVSVDIGGWYISDAQGRRHTFSENTILPANGVAVVFGGFNSEGNFGGAVVQDTSSLGLNNGGDMVTLKDALGNTIDEHTYGSEGGDDQSLVRNPEITGSFVKHSEVTGAGGILFSPGTKADGSQFTTTIVLEGNAGWRMLSAPAEGIPIQYLANFVPIQGYGSSDDKNFYTGYDGSAFVPAASDLSGNLNSGEGFILFVYNNNEFGSSTLPIYLDVGSYSEPTSDVTVNMHASGDRWNLLGNPYQTAFNVTSIIPTEGSLGSAAGHIWSDADESYILTSSNNDKVASGQGFFIQNDETTPATSVNLPLSGKASGTQFYKSNESKAFVQLTLISEDVDEGRVQKDLSTVLYFHENAESGSDKFDSDKLYPLKPAFSLLGFSSPSSEMLKAQDSRSFYGEGEEIFDLDIMAYNVKADQSIMWEKSNNIPEEWEFIFIDNHTDEEVVMDENFEYSFQHAVQAKAKSPNYSVIENPLSVSIINIEPRFTIRLNRGTATSNQLPSTVPDQFVLEQNYPNPFNPTTEIRYEVSKQAKVSIDVFNLMGQKVATLVDQVQSPGTYRAVWDASSQASGVYYYRLKAGNTVMTRNMTLIK